MPTWKKVIVSGSAAELLNVTSSNGLLVGTNQQIGTTQATTFLTGSFTGSFKGDGTNLTGVTATAVFPTAGIGILSPSTNVFVNGGSNASASVAQFNSSSWTGISGDITVNTSGVATLKSGIISASNQVFTASVVSGVSSLQLTGASTSLTGSFTGSFAGAHTGTFPYASLTGTPSGIVSASTLSSNSQGTVTSSINGVATNVDLQLKTTNTPTFAGLTTTGNVSIGGNLSVAGVISGSVTYISASNVAITDQFILLASGSTGNIDGGIIVQNAANAGEALFWDSPAARWAITSSLSTTANVVTTPSHYIVTVTASAGIPTANVYGGSSAGQGNIYVNSSDESIWIYS